MLLVRRRAPEGSYFKDGDRASGVFGVLAGGFAIFAGFIIFLAFTTYDQSRSGARGRGAHRRAAVRDGAVPARRCARPAGGRARLLRALGRAPGVAADGGGRRAATRSTPGRSRCSDAAAREPEDRRPSRPPTRSGSTRPPIARQARNDRLHGAEGIIPTSIWLVLFLIARRRLRLHAVLRRQRRGRRRPGDADRLGDHRDRAHAARDQRARQPLPRRSRADQPVAMERSLRILDERTRAS